MRNVATLCAVGLLVLIGGCRLLEKSDASGGRSPLRPARPSRDSVTMEVVWARFPEGDAQLCDALWDEIDEARIDASVRHRLTQNGFRVGVVGGTPPAAIARALSIDAYAAARDDVNEAGKRSDDDANSIDQSPEMMVEPIVHGNIKQLRRGVRMEIRASETFASVPLLLSDGRNVVGTTYLRAQAVYALRVDPQPDQSVAVKLTPELHYGQPRLRWTGGEEGILRQAPLRDRRVFDNMQIDVQLAPGEMLLLMSLPESGSRLGHYFHTVDSADGRQQKLVLIRLAQVPPSETFAVDH